jgi:putative sigma-54 modulation protein
MRIDVKGRNLPVSEELREHVAKRFRKVERQVSELAELEVEVREERNPAIADSEIAEATLHLKGVTLRASAASPDIVHSVNLVSDELARQVKRNREKRRGRRQARAAAVAGTPNPEPPVRGGELVLEGDTVIEAEVIPTPEDLPRDGSSAA